MSGDETAIFVSLCRERGAEENQLTFFLSMNFILPFL